MNDRIANTSLLLGSTILVFTVSILCVSTIFYILGFPISGYSIIVAACAGVAFGWHGAKRYFTEDHFRQLAVVILSIIALAITAIYFSGSFYDISFDGQSCHQEAIIQLKNGWNPFHDPSLKHVANSDWINAYPKGPWINAAALYQTTNDIEQGKAFNFLLIFASFFLCLAAYLTFDKNGLGKAVAISALLALNPVSVDQSLSFYVDGQLASLLIALAALAYLLFRKADKLILTAIAATIIMAVNIKFTGIVYTSIFSAGLFAWLFIYGKKEYARNVLIVVAASSLIGLLVVGFNPYVTNTIRHGNPFYPLVGAKVTDIMSDDTPGNLLGMNRFEKFFASLFSKSENVTTEGHTTYKWPFTLIDGETAWLAEKPDIRAGGFGPLFSGSFILALSIILIALLLKPKNTLVLNIIGLIIVLAASIFVNPACWWARYVPQLWVVPFLAVVLALYAFDGKQMRILGWLLITALAANTAIVSVVYFNGQAAFTDALTRQLSYIAGQHQPVLVKFNDFNSNRLRLQAFGIAYKEVEKAPVSEPFKILCSEAVLFRGPVGR